MLPLLHAPSGHLPYVLVADDRENDAELVQLAFSRLSIVRELVWVRDGQTALQMLSQAEQPLPQLVMMDLNMPNVDGIALVQQIRAHARTACIPVVLMSASSHDNDVRRALSAGANSYVVKPVDFQQFTQQVGLIANYWLTVHRTPGLG